ncbi:hypothetical protein [Pseudomonas sp. O11]|uniref:hypothetical protein n=1 Tax=Pseudomonas sp. O11 TaxID=3159446 RepID=UPI00387AD922
MKIESAIPHVQPTAMGVPEAGRASSPPNVQPPGDDHFAPPEVARPRPGLWRGTSLSPRRQALQNAPTVRANTTPPGPSFTDSQLTSEFQKHFGELHDFLQDGRLTLSSLRKIAAQPLGGD